jgi:hypothetical protein
MTRAPSVSSLSTFPRTLSEGVRCIPAYGIVLVLVLMVPAALLPYDTTSNN